MRVNLRRWGAILGGAGGHMEELRISELLGGDPLHIVAGADAGDTGMAFDIAHRGVDGARVGVDDAAVSRDEAHDRHRLGRAHGEVPTRRMFAHALAGGAEAGAIGQIAAEQRGELVGFDFAVQAECLDRAALPQACGFAAPVVVHLIIAARGGGIGDLGERCDHYRPPMESQSSRSSMRTAGDDDVLVGGALVGGGDGVRDAMGTGTNAGAMASMALGGAIRTLAIG